MTIADLEIITADDTPTSPSRAAIDDTAPFALALIPFGLAVGGASAAAGLSFGTAMFGALVLLAGAAQLAAVETLGSGGDILAVVIVAGLINVRFVLYGAGVATWFEGLPLRHRLLLVYPVVDQTFMLCQRRFEEERDLGWRQQYYLTVTALLVAAFIGSQVLAFQLGSGLPAGLGLHLAAPLAFAGMLAGSVRGRTELITGLVAAVIVIGSAGVLGPLGLPVGVVAGVAAGIRVSS